jgi:ankyrin repeat protein
MAGRRQSIPLFNKPKPTINKSKPALEHSKPQQPETTPLFQALTDNDIPTVLLLLSSGVDIESRDTHSHTPLIAAAISGHTLLVQELLSHGASIDAKTTDGHTALHKACFAMHEPVINLLLSSGADWTRSPPSPLFAAIEENDTSTVRRLISSGVSIESRNCYTRTPLIAAAAYGYTSLVQHLITRGAYINAKTVLGRTALHEACFGWYIREDLRGDQLSVIKVLIENGADKEATEPHYGGTALTIAVMERNIEMVRLLLNKGVDIEVKDHNKKTPLVLANTCPGIRDLLLQFGAKYPEPEVKEVKKPRAERVMRSVCLPRLPTPSTPSPASSFPTSPAPPTDAPVPGRESGVVDVDKWCALCVRDGHNSGDCSFETDNLATETEKKITVHELSSSPEPPAKGGPVAGKESGDVDMECWCAWCWRYGHDSVDCPFETDNPFATKTRSVHLPRLRPSLAVPAEEKVAEKDNEGVVMDRWCSWCDKEGHDTVHCPFRD